MTRKISKKLSYWLRHAPDIGNLALDAAGWANADDVRSSLAKAGLDPAQLEQVVADNDKRRFEFSSDGKNIRARQGHSVKVNLDWPIKAPPEFLFHGTVDRFLDAIMTEGRKPMSRHHVHLSPDRETAARVGSRRGQPIILRVAAKEMASQGSVFYLTDNDIWLTDAVSPTFIIQP